MPRPSSASKKSWAISAAAPRGPLSHLCRAPARRCRSHTLALDGLGILLLLVLHAFASRLGLLRVLSVIPTTKLGFHGAGTRDMIPAMEGVAGLLFAPTSPEGAVIQGATQLQADRAKDAAAERDPDTRNTKLQKVAADVAANARVAKLQKQALAPLARKRPAEASDSNTGLRRSRRGQPADSEARMVPLPNPAVRMQMSAGMIDALKKVDARKRVPVLASFCRLRGCTREAVQEESGIKISKDTWAASRRHAYWPGAFEPIPKLSMPRQGIKTERLTQLLKWLQNPGLLQQYAFGEKVFKALNGEMLENV